jgi:transposase
MGERVDKTQLVSRIAGRLSKDPDEIELVADAKKNVTDADLEALIADEGWKDQDIIQAFNTSRSTVERTRKRLVEGGLEKALNEDPRPGQRTKLDAKAEAHLIALACSEAPGGREHWPLRLLADKLVELGLVETISHEAVRQKLKKMC